MVDEKDVRKRDGRSEGKSNFGCKADIREEKKEKNGKERRERKRNREQIKRGELSMERGRKRKGKSSFGYEVGGI